MKRTLLFALALAATVVAGAGLVFANAGHCGGLRGMLFKRIIERRVDAALDAVKASQEQRNAVEAARDHVFAALEESRADEQTRREQALQLFAADKLDTGELAALRTAHRAAAQKVGDALIQALHDTHDALTADQRKLLVDWVRSEFSARQGRRAAFAEKMPRMLTRRIDDALDAAKATPAQRTAIAGTRDRLVAALAAAHTDPRAHLDELLTLFLADKLDDTRLGALRAEHQARAQKLGDAVIAAFGEAHDQLSSAQRHAIADWAQKHACDHGG